ncbi:MAG: hypothetical protein JWM68_1537 [Verrucomicrobiales bacterium]|nr:hypothetical protein [Verrucomicrobiales bacterium]
MGKDASPLNPKTKRKPILLRMILTVLTLFVLLCVVGCALQRKLIYFPTKLTPTAAAQVAAEGGFLPWKNKEDKIIGWYLPAKGASTGSVLVIHGNAGYALNRSYFAQPIHEAALVDVYILEYPGFGAREGSPSMKSFLEAADEAFDMLPDKTPRYVVSESIGTGPATYLAKSHSRDVAGFALFVPYNDFVSLGKARMPFLPVSLILLDRYDPAKWISEYSGPIKFVVAENDEVIPAKFGLKLHDAFRGPKLLEVIPQAHHNDVSEQSPEWWNGVFSFWRQHARP